MANYFQQKDLSDWRHSDRQETEFDYQNTLNSLNQWIIEIFNNELTYPVSQVDT